MAHANGPSTTTTAMETDGASDASGLSVRVESMSSAERARRGRHWLLTLMVAGNYAALDMEIALLYFLLAKSDVGCDYIPSYAAMKSWQFLALCVFRPLSGVITDLTAQWADWVLLFVSVVELVTLVVMVLVALFVPDFSAWFLLGMQLVKNLVEAQMYNSIWKIFKMRLEFHYNVGTGSQCQVLTRIGLTGEAIELVWDGVTCATGYYLMHHVKVPYNVALLLYFGSSILASMLCCVVAVLIVLKPNYFMRADDASDASSSSAASDDGGEAGKPGLQDPHGDVHRPLLTGATIGEPAFPSHGTAAASRSVSVDPGGMTTRAPLLAHPGNSVRRRNSATAVPHGSETALLRRAVSTHWYEENDKGDLLAPSLMGYAKESYRAVFGNPVARRAIIHSFLVFIPYAILGNAEAIALPMQHMVKPKDANLDNFCAGLISNVAYQDTIINITYLLGVAFYYYVLRRFVGPVLFYSWVYPVTSIAFLGLCVLLMFDMPALVAYVVSFRACWLGPAPVHARGVYVCACESVVRACPDALQPVATLPPAPPPPCRPIGTRSTPRRCLPFGSTSCTTGSWRRPPSTTSTTASTAS